MKMAKWAGVIYLRRLIIIAILSKKFSLKFSFYLFFYKVIEHHFRKKEFPIKRKKKNKLFEHKTVMQA